MSAKLYIVRYITARFSIHLQGEIASIRSKSDICFSLFFFLLLFGNSFSPHYREGSTFP